MKKYVKCAIAIVLLIGSIWGIVNQFRINDLARLNDEKDEEIAELSAQRTRLIEALEAIPMTEEETTIFEKNKEAIQNAWGPFFEDEKLARIIWWFHRTGDIANPEISSLSDKASKAWKLVMEDQTVLITTWGVYAVWKNSRTQSNILTYDTDDVRS